MPWCPCVLASSMLCQSLSRLIPTTLKLFGCAVFGEDYALIVASSGWSLSKSPKHFVDALHGEN
jgi:hypothetical protein